MGSTSPSPYRRAGYSLDIESETLPKAVAAVWGGFLFEGLLTSQRNPDRAKHVLRYWAGERLALMEESCRYLDRIWILSRPLWRRWTPPEGVFEYDVVAAFGELLGYQLMLSHGQLPEQDEADAVIEDLLKAYFKTADGDPGRPSSH